MPKLNTTRFYRIKFLLNDRSYFLCPDTKRVFDAKCRLVRNAGIIKQVRSICASNAALAEAA